MNILLSLSLSALLALIAIITRAFTPLATVLAFVMSLIICNFAGFLAFFSLTFTFLLTVLASKSAGEKADPKRVRKKSGKRDAVRVLCNVGIATISVILYKLTKNNSFYIAYACVIAESLGDSLASKLGPLTKYRTIDILTFKYISPGLSGGISLLGTISSFLGCILIAFIALFPFGLKTCAIGAFIAFVGCLFDSVMGSLVQVKYKCPVCDALVEREYHCGEKTQKYKGLRFINNDVVNILSNVFTFILAVIVL